jgi:H/ACA ribonucleoprotein complex non-core subunit NAF1
MRSRAQTPAHMQDQELAGANDGASVTDSDAFYGANPYDAHGPYDSGAGGGRTLVSYDDPYAEAGPSASSSTESGVTVAINDLIAASQPPPQPEAGPSGARPPLSPPGTEQSRPARGRGRGRGRGGPGFGDAGGGRGRGRGQMREQRGRGRGRGAWQPRGGHAPQAPGFDARQPPNAGAPAAGKRRELSPTSLAIARATGQYTDGSTFMVQPPPAPGMNMNWGMPPGQQPGLGMGQAPVQGHINPRFAAQWAMNGGWPGAQAWGGGWPPTTGYPPPPGAGGT